MGDLVEIEKCRSICGRGSGWN